MEEVTRAVQTSLHELYSIESKVILTRPDPQFGDFATNIAMQVTKQLEKNPRNIAEELAASLVAKGYEASVAGPGFLNIRVNDAAILKLVEATEHLPQPLKGQVVVAEYSDPNPFKVLHAGHLYTTIVGDAIAHVIESAGATVHRVNFGGDVGLHVGKTMWAILRNLGGESPDKLGAVTADQRLEWLSARYVEGNDAYEDDEAAKADIVGYNKRVYEVHATQDHESDFAKIYWTCRTWSYEGFDALYEQLQVHPFEAYLPESEVTPAGLEVSKRALENGVLQQSDGAVVFKGEAAGLHTRVFINSAGLPTYETKDLGLAATKWERFHFDKSFIITANDIVEYMKVVMNVLSHFYPEATERTKHLTHGVIKLPGGVKMSSRKGNILRAVDILDAAREANKQISGKSDEVVVLGAVKYAFLKQRMGGDIIYDPTESLSTEGNSGPYLQYAYARACSIMKKADNQTGKLEANFTPYERTLASKIGEFPEVIAEVLQEYMPHHIGTYLYELTQVFNRFYENERVVGDDRQSHRLGLLSAYKEVLKKGLNLLGITAPESM